jgi:hypothetical protein
MLSLLAKLMLAKNGASGVGSALRLSRRLTQEQRAVLEKLPPLTAYDGTADWYDGLFSG